MANTFELELDLTTAGLGIQVAGGRDDESPGIFVVSVNPAGAAARAGIKANDQLVTVNGETLATLEHDDVVALLARLRERATIMVTRLRDLVITISDPDGSNRALEATSPTDMEMPEAARAEMARRAFEMGNIEASKLAHDMPQEKHDSESGAYVKAAVFGGLDGIITTFAVVASVAGASLATEVVVCKIISCWSKKLERESKQKRKEGAGDGGKQKSRDWQKSCRTREEYWYVAAFVAAFDFEAGFSARLSWGLPT